MIEYICELQSHPEIHQIVFFDGATHNQEKTVLLLAMLKQIHQIFLIGNSEKQLKKLKYYVDHELSTSQEQCSVMITSSSKISASNLVENDFALVFDGAKSVDEVLSLTEINPPYLFGGIWRPNFSPMPIWEAFRKKSRKIYIASYAPNSNAEILDWTQDKSNNVELSVVFPVYNVEQYLDECIASITAWDADYVEFLFINDGSPDNSREKILEYSALDSRVKLIDKVNGGCASARQKGLDVAQGRYIGFVDPDDFVDPNMFCSLFYRAMIGSYDIAYCGYKEYYNDTHTIKNAIDVLSPEYTAGTTDLARIHGLIAFCRVAIWRGIYRRGMLEANKIGFYTDLRRFDDLPFMVETFACAKSVAAVPQYYYYYRLARPGQDVSANDERLYVHFDIFEHLERRCKKIGDPEISDYLQIRKVQTHRYALEKINDSCFNEYCRKAHNDLPGNNFFSIIYYYFYFKKQIGKISALYFLTLKMGTPLLVRLVRQTTKRKEQAIIRKRQKVEQMFTQFI